MIGVALQPSIERGRQGGLHVMRFVPTGAAPRSVVVAAQPFAEEANKSRRMMALAARAMARAGHAVVVPDLYGTMDSEGDFAEARWDDWIADFAALAVAESERFEVPAQLWGVRAGALIAAGALPALPGGAALLLWAPVVSGEQALIQFLRLRTATSMMEGTRESVNQLRARLTEGEALEVAGYEFAPELAASLAGASLAPPAATVPGALHCLTVGPSVPPAVQRALEGWEAIGWSVDLRAVDGDAFWSTQEIATAPELIAPSVAAVNAALGEPA